MDYSSLNNILNGLEISQNSQNNTQQPTQPQQQQQSYINQEYRSGEMFRDINNHNSNKNPKSKKSNDNTGFLFARNRELQQMPFNFEAINPQRMNTYVQEPRQNLKESNTSISNYELNRGIQVNNLIPKHINVMDYSAFSENYKSYKNTQTDESNFKDEMNNKLLSRDNIPNISSVPSNLWER